MQLIGFNLKKISAEKSPKFKTGTMNTNIEFTDVDKQKIDLLKEAEAVKISFLFTVSYTEAEKEKTENDEKKQQLEKFGELVFDGDMMLSSTKDEADEIINTWKKKQIPDQFRIPLINYILKKCSTKALSLEDDLNLPLHIPFPQIRKPEKNNSS
jgi:hypothetical protein